MVKIFFDFDGTLVASGRRLYALFQELVEDSSLSFEDYWSLKRQKIGHKEILEKYFPNQSFEEFNKKWLDLIESPKKLSMDTLYPETKKILTNLSKKHTLYLVTARQSEEELYKELTRFALLPFFEKIFITKLTKNKGNFIKNEGATSQDFLIGDTGYDILTGKACNLTTIAITHGFLSAEVLATYKPDVLINSLNELEEIINA